MSSLDAAAHSHAADTAPVRPGWRLALSVWAGLVAALGLLLWRDVVGLVSVWWNSATYEHCLLIPPIIAYLVWIRRHEVAQLTPRPFLPAAILMLLGGVGWLLGQYAGVALVRHTALVGLFIVSVPLVFGLTVARGLLFPLFYCLFMIPVGNQLIPALQMITADMSIRLLDLFSVPAYIDGVFIEIPNGSFEVAEACSGVRFLIAMVAFSVLVAHLCFKSTIRRILCVVSAVSLAIIANGIRAWGTIYIAWRTDPSFAEGVDHVIYGWFFFAIVMALVLGVGWFFFDRPVDDPAFDPQRLESPPKAPAVPRAFAVAGIAGLAATLAVPALGFIASDRDPSAEIAVIDMPDVPGWRQVETTGSGWTPLYENSSARAQQVYENAAGDRVSLYVAAYDRQSQDHEMISFGNGLYEPEGDWSWSRGIPSPPGAHGEQIQRRPWVRDIWRWYVIGGDVVAGDYAAKMKTLQRRLLGGRTDAGVVVLSVERSGPMGTPASALGAFMDAAGSPLFLYEAAAGLD